MIAELYRLPGTFDFWRPFCLSLLARCDKLVVVKLDGWEESRGIKEEIAEAIRLKIPHMFTTMNELASSRVLDMISSVTLRELEQ